MDLHGKSCPCAEGWVCDTATDTCIFNGNGSGGGDGSVVTDSGAGDTGLPGDGGGDTGTMTDGSPMDTGMAGAVMVFVEAESGMLQAPMATGTDAAASGGSYVSSATASADIANPMGTDGRVRISFDVPAMGTYRIWGRVKTGPDDGMGNNDPDSFWACVDADPPNATDCIQWNNIPGNDAFEWDDIHDSDNGDMAVDFTLAAGAHQLDVYVREAGTQLDRVLVTDDLTLMAASIP